MKIVLASASPRREKLLKMLVGDNFQIDKSTYDETDSGNPVICAVNNALGKGREVSKRHTDALVISADTLVYLDKIYGKPKDPEEAENILDEFSGKWVNVITGIALVDTRNRIEESDYVITRVKFRSLEKKEIQDYVRVCDPMDKAGAFGSEDLSVSFIEKIDGDYNNVLGLPLFRLSSLLKNHDIDIFELWKPGC